MRIIRWVQRMYWKSIILKEYQTILMQLSSKRAKQWGYGVLSEIFCINPKALQSFTVNKEGVFMLKDKMSSSELGALWTTHQKKTMIQRILEYFY